MNHFSRLFTGRGGLRTVATIVLLALALPLVVFADNVVNDVTVGVGGTDTFTLGGSTIISYKVVGTGGDGQSGCNADDGSSAVVTINVPAGVTATPNTLTFTACNVFKPVTFTASAAGSFPITVSVSDAGAGTYNLTPASFNLHVLAADDSTPPVIEPTVIGTLGLNGWYVSDVSVTWSVTDLQSAITSSSGCGPTTISSDTAGMTLTCSATSAGGFSSQSVMIKRDATPPTIGGSRAPLANSNGWNNSDVTVSFSCGDAMSGVFSCTSPVTLSGEGALQSAGGSAVDFAGNSASATVSGINIDKTAPSVSASASPAANGNGWNNSNVTVSFSGTDGLSGIASCSTPVILSSEGAGQSASGSCADLAGNSASATASGINIDKTAPSLSWSGGITDGDSFYFGFVPAAPTCSAIDALSGVDGGCSVSGYSAAVGTHTLTAAASDLAGNSASETRSYSVLAWRLSGFYNPVDMTPVGGATVWNTVKNGSTVPLKFEVFAGTLELTSTSIVKQPLKATQVLCAGGTEESVDMLSSGSTVLRYDETAGQFIYNWQTPKGRAGYCYAVTVGTQDGSALVAYFKLK